MTEILQILIAIISPISSIAIIFIGFRHSKNLILIEKNNEFKIDIKRNAIEKSEELVSSLFLLNRIIEDVFKDMSFLVTQTEESVDLKEMLEKNKNGQENYRNQIIKCRTYLNIYFPKYRNEFEKYQIEHDTILFEAVSILHGNYTSKERIEKANSVQEKSRYLSSVLENITNAVITDIQYSIKLKN